MKGQDIARVRRRQAIATENARLRQALKDELAHTRREIDRLNLEREARLHPAGIIRVDPYQPPRRSWWSALFGGPRLFDRVEW